MAEKILHIGQHKCCSTTIQYLLSKDMSGTALQFLGPEYQSLRKLLGQVVMSSKFTSKDLEAASTKFSQFNYISSESFCGQFDDIYRGSYLHYLPSRLWKVFPDYQILFVVRDPVDLIASIYVDNIVYGRVVSFKTWLGQLVSRGWNTFWRYDYIYEGYSSVFDNVQVVGVNDVVNKSGLDLIDSLFPSLKETLSDVPDKLPVINPSPTWISFILQLYFVNRVFLTKNSTGQHTGNMKNGGPYNYFRYTVSPALSKLGGTPASTYIIERYGSYIRELLKGDLAKTYEFCSTHGVNLNT